MSDGSDEKDDKIEVKGQEKGEKILIAMTGGVDSTVAAFLLKKQGYQPIGIGMLMLDPEKDEQDLQFLNGCRVQNLDQINKLCQQLEIPFYAVKAQSLFKDKVLDPLVANRISGFESFPCFQCNWVKLKLLVEKAKLLGVNKVATGHYAKVNFNKESKRFQIYSANDHDNDQSHLLSCLDQEMLSYLVLPMGDIRRVEAEKLIKNFNFPVVEKFGHRELCFNKNPEFPQFVARKSDRMFCSEGTILNYNNDGHMGEHKGLQYYRLGQNNIKSNQPTAIIDKNMEVVKINMQFNNIYLAPPGSLVNKSVLLYHYTPVSSIDLTKPQKVFVKLEDVDERIEGTVFYKTNDMAIVELKKEVKKLIREQDVVLYNKPDGISRVIGHGRIYYTGDFHRLNRAESVEDIPQDEEGNALPIIGRDFGF